ncbi:MAG: thermonuclease family protein [Nitrospirae bacterium]|nr:thermonuclease family protein [Nitrospirota bacterium]
MSRACRLPWLLALAVLAAPGYAAAHGVALDTHGCHHDRRAGDYHCHQGPLAGRVFPSRKVAGTTLWLVQQLAAQGADALALTADAQVIDGDTLELDGRRVRIHGIDAPERDQTCRAHGADTPCGQQATAAMRALVSGHPVTCVVAEVDTYGRLLGTCQGGNGADLGRAMVASGWALAFRHFSERYVPDEERARAMGAGIWAGEFTPPREWRRSHPR